MDRRRFLAATTAAVGTGTLAGCAALGGPTALTDTDTETDDDGMERHIHFSKDGTRQATLSIDQGSTPATYTDRFSLQLHLWHHEDLRTERMAFELRGPPGGAGVPAEIYLKVPDGGPWPDFRIEKGDNLATKIAVDDLGELGRGTLHLELFVDPVSEPVDQLKVAADLTFSRGGALAGSYRAETLELFDVVAESDQPN